MPNIFDAIDYAMAICWNENYGYRIGGHAASYNDGTDCCGLVFHCLHQAGFPGIPDTSPGVHNMHPYMINAGFTEIPYDRTTFVPQDGDIITMYNPNVSPHIGHTFFYAENIRAYTDANAYSDHIGNVQHAKVEASDTRGHSGPGDSRRNGTGAYWEVWCHAYNNLIDHSRYPNDSMVKVYRIGGYKSNKWLLFQWPDQHKKHPLPFNPNMLY